MEPGLLWYHTHVHGTAAYSYMSSLFGFMVVEGTDRDITKAPGIEGATEIIVALSEGLVNDDKSVPPFFPIVGQFNWKSVANGVLGELTEYQVTQGETVLFRVVSATVEPTIRLSMSDTSFVIVAYDGLPLPEPVEVEVVTVSGGSRVEFLARFNAPGTYVMNRAGWNQQVTSPELCLEIFGAPFFPCISYGIEQIAFTVTVLPDDSFVAATTSLISEVELPVYSEKLVALAATEPVDEKIVALEQALTYPIFQVPYDGPFIPPGVGFGVNGRLMTPWHYAGNVTAGTCETWTVTSFPPFSEHPFHSHTSRFMITHIDGVEVEEPFWRDTFPINGFNFTAHICFDALEPGDSLLTHCHMPSHLDIGLGTFYRVVAGAENPMEPSSAVSSTIVLASVVAMLVSLALW
jgi:FtsP/CotA-like multicopper oxidase with cupredoxin domain